MKKSLGFGKRVWGDKPRLDYRVLNTIKARVEAGEVPEEVLETIYLTYQTE
jgi:hypothetical protein